MDAVLLGFRGLGFRVLFMVHGYTGLLPRNFKLVKLLNRETRLFTICPNYGNLSSLEATQFRGWVSSCSKKGLGLGSRASWGLTSFILRLSAGQFSFLFD